MAPLATEFANLYLKAGLDITDPSKPEHQTWEETLATVSSQDGFKQAYYGMKSLCLSLHLKKCAMTQSMKYSFKSFSRVTIDRNHT